LNVLSSESNAERRRAFIAANTRVLMVSHAPEIFLYLADDATALWQKTEDELSEIGLPPPYWAFAWAGGQALARYILDHPGIVRGKRVLDVASGSGIVAIAAARARAREVVANEIDDYALTAIGLNAGVNEVNVQLLAGDVIGQAVDFDVVLAGDIFYDRDMSARMADWLQSLSRQGVTVLVGDPGRSYLPREKLEKVAQYSVAVTRDLEDSEIKKTAVWRFIRPGAGPPLPITP
jgi:predicted nicotinamide N-methyase